MTELWEAWKIKFDISEVGDAVVEKPPHCSVYLNGGFFPGWSTIEDFVYSASRIWNLIGLEVESVDKWYEQKGD